MNDRTQVHFVDDTVRRARGPWSDSVHALLRHYEAVGFDGAPRVIGSGFDEQGFEVLSFVPGEFVHPHVWSDAGIHALGQLLRELHTAGANFEPPAGASWQPWFTRAKSDDFVYGHGDVGPWNIVARAGEPVAFIDWEFAGPVDRLDEVAHAAWLNAQLHDDVVASVANLPPAADRARQLRLFVDGYGLAADERVGLVTRMIDFAVRDAANELAMDGGFKMAKRPTGPDDPGWGPAWRIRAAAWLVEHRALLEGVLR